MAKSKTPVYIDNALLEAAASRAAETGETADAVVESALRVYLGGLAAVLRKIRPTNGLKDEDALKLAYEELDASRNEES